MPLMPHFRNYICHIFCTFVSYFSNYFDIFQHLCLYYWYIFV